jgi:3',5'-cyclic AMP phosphodiesterase CpdA
MSTVGNHEMERNAGELGYDGYLARFRPPGSASMPVTYAFRYGNVGFVALDANDVSAEITRNNGYLGEEQDAWLDATLAELRRDPRIEFVVVGFHHCMYCSNAFHGSDGGPRQRWGATFDRHAVDLVINGHNHCYERTHPLRGGEVVDGGTVYVTAGGGGQAEYPTGTYPVSYVHAGGGLRVPEPALWSAVRFLHHSIAVVDVSPGLLHVRALDTAGAVADEFTVRSKVLARG